jgi:hypothetical protein
MPIVVSLKVGPACIAPASTDPDQYIDKEAGIMGWGTATGNKRFLFTRHSGLYVFMILY